MFAVRGGGNTPGFRLLTLHHEICVYFGLNIFYSKNYDKAIYICVFQVSRSYLGFCPDPKHFIVNCEQNVVKFAGKWGKMY